MISLTVKKNTYLCYKCTSYITIVNLQENKLCKFYSIVSTMANEQKKKMFENVD